MLKLRNLLSGGIVAESIPHRITWNNMNKKENQSDDGPDDRESEKNAFSERN